MDENIEVKRVDVFDLDYKGCRGCLGCQMKRTVEVGCVVKDGAHDLLKEIRTADGLVFATPIYFMEISAQLRALFERLFYPGFGAPPTKGLSVSAIYTMNQPQEVMEKLFRHPIDVMRRYFKELFQAEVDEVFAFQTLQWRNNELYRFSDEFYRERVEFHEQQWDKDLRSAFAAGVHLAKCVTQNEQFANLITLGGAKSQPRGANAPRLFSQSLIPCGFRGSLNDRQGGARGFIVNRV